MGHNVDLSCDTRTRLKKIAAMTGHSFNTMLENAIMAGVAEIISTYSENKKYKNVFPKFFPEFDQGVQSLETAPDGDHSDDMTPEQKAFYIKSAQERYAHGSNDDIEIDDTATCSEVEDGVWVQAHVWVAKPSDEEEE